MSVRMRSDSEFDIEIAAIMRANSEIEREIDVARENTNRAIEGTERLRRERNEVETHLREVNILANTIPERMRSQDVRIAGLSLRIVDLVSHIKSERLGWIRFSITELGCLIGGAIVAPWTPGLAAAVVVGGSIANVLGHYIGEGYNSLQD